MCGGALVEVSPVYDLGLSAAGVTVEHIMDGEKNVIHPYTSAARIESGKLVYGAAE